VPDTIKKELEDGSYVKHFSFTSDFMIDYQDDEIMRKKVEEFTIKIEAKSKSGNISLSDATGFFKSLFKNQFGKSGNSRTLGEFRSAKAHVENPSTNSKGLFDIDKNLKIKPTIYLKDRVNLNEDGVPVFSELKDFCDIILEGIKKEILPENAVFEA